eukprot:5924067-Pleurochrysis_carterae.AAC.1
MSAAEQTAKTRVYTGDCVQHMHKIILAAMSAAGSALLKNKLGESLADFYSYERMSTDIIALIRAIYKELQPEGNYAKGKGKSEFMPWLIQNHGAAPYIPLERADGVPSTGAKTSILTPLHISTPTASFF